LPERTATAKHLHVNGFW